MANIWRRQQGRTIARYGTGLRTSNLYRCSNGQNICTIANTFFEAIGPVTYAAILKRWTGSAWAKAKLKRYNGSSFVDATLKVYKAGSFQTVDTTGV